MNETCGINIAGTSPPSQCGRPAGTLLISACRYGHTETMPICADHLNRAWEGSLRCTPCHRVEHRVTATFPQVMPMRAAAA